MSSNQDQKMWTWKVEPISPSGTPPPDTNDDEWLSFEYETPVDTPSNATEQHMYDDHPTRAQVATKLLEELDEWIKEEPFSNWLEQKIEIPIFDELPAPECVQNRGMIYPELVKEPQHQQQDTTQTLLQEFESVLGDVEACHQITPPIGSSTLTPPQSPPPLKIPPTGTQLLVTLQPLEPMPMPMITQQSNYHTMTVPVTKQASFLGQFPASQAKLMFPVEQWNPENVSLEPLGGDVARELAAVDEYVRSCAEDIPPASPCTSSGGSYMSSEDSVDDPDWTPESVPIAETSRPGPSSKSRRKPYSRPNVEDKKVRKKEQNKNAATRYRQKKKLEVEEILGEERELADHNEKLENQVKDLQREIGYLKGLMRDLFKAKGLMK
ncbi:activating transcription factor of chaperone isoform X2 [Cephus cinctus]|uniref:Activating transcription factor of chaperone isoform X2 n=1 Tax=Cephus cinctus TaxID=211228 RepID=A0AAJ7FGL1_CEPCN|nr:activating transcription factor of chaperone isoform X2 [Cephus cinctus]